MIKTLNDKKCRNNASRPRRFSFLTGCLLGLAAISSQGNVIEGSGEPLPTFSAYDQNSELFRLQDHTGGPLVIHICALWCYPCRDLARIYPEIASELESLGVRDITVVDLLLQNNYSGPSDLTDAQLWKNNVGGPPRILHTEGASGLDAIAASVTVFPSSIVVDAGGNVAGTIEGYYSADVFARILAEMIGDSTLTIAIDIQPGSDTNCVNINGRGVIPVAILGSSEFDVSYIDQQTLTFGGLDVRVRGNKGPLCGLDDVNADGNYDLVCKFEDNSDAWVVGEDSAVLSGALFDGTAFEGEDRLCIVP